MSHFNHVANEWDSPEKIQLITKLANKTREIINLGGNLDVLDFGCGTGLFGMAFLENAKSMTGIDTSESMLEEFKKKSSAVNTETLLVDLESEEINREFDLIVSSMAFHHLCEPSIVFNKLFKMLRAGGKIIIVDLEEEDGSFHPDPNAMGVKHFGFSRSEIDNWCLNLSVRKEIYTINKVTKSEKTYAQFLAVFTK